MPILDKLRAHSEALLDGVPPRGTLLRHHVGSLVNLTCHEVSDRRDMRLRCLAAGSDRDVGGTPQ